MRQQILENQVRDLKAIIDTLLDELDTMSDHLPHESKQMLHIEAALKTLRQRADDVLAL